MFYACIGGIYILCINLELGSSRWIVHERRSARSERNRTPLLHFRNWTKCQNLETEDERPNKRTKDNPVPLFPHLRDDRLTRIDRPSKPMYGQRNAHPLLKTKENIPDFDVLVIAIRLEDMSTCETKRAETMKDRFVKSSDSSKVGVDLEGLDEHVMQGR